MNRRRMPWVIVLGTALVLASLWWLAPLSKTTQAAPAPSGDAAFKGKVLLVHSSNMLAVFLLEKAQVQKVGDALWLMGKYAAEDDSYEGRTVWLRMEHIIAIVEYDDLKQARKAVKSSGVSIRVPGYSSLPPPTKMP